MDFLSRFGCVLELQCRSILHVADSLPCMQHTFSLSLDIVRELSSKPNGNYAAAFQEKLTLALAANPPQKALKTEKFRKWLERLDEAVLMASGEEGTLVFVLIWRGRGSSWFLVS